MGRIKNRLKPTSGFSHLFHIVLTLLLPLLLFILIRLNFMQLAVIVILLSKWRMFAVRPRHWLANIRANAVDLVVGISIVLFMGNTSVQAIQLIWGAMYAVWLLVVKPKTSFLGTATQAFVAQLFGLSAIFIAWGASPLFVLVLATWLVCYASARHFFTGFDEPYASFLAHVWGYFGASLVWLSGHWLRFYPNQGSGFIAQPSLLLNVLAFGLASLYYLEKTDRLSVFLRRQFIFIMIAVVVIIIAFSGWSDKTI